ncbi:MAG: photosystem II biosynthesis protein, partial [Cyanobacteria bacterium J06607_17]
GLGVLGLSYGVLSASWQEDEAGSLLGLTEFSINFRRLVQGLRKKPSESE